MKKRKKKKKNSKQFNRQFKKTFFTKKSAIIIVCTVIILSAFWGAYQKVERKAAKYQKTIDELKTEVKNLNQTNKTLEKEKNNIDTDESKERIARERLGMIKRGRNFFAGSPGRRISEYNGGRQRRNHNGKRRSKRSDNGKRRSDNTISDRE